MDVPIAVGLGLVASFRRSHIHNEALPEEERKSEWSRPLWVAGFVVFLAANISGTIFQIGTLPVVILAPLGAVSLLYNALLARVLLNDFLSRHMAMGSTLIAVGALLIAYFGSVPEEPRSLKELLDLYERPSFVAFAMLYLLVFVSVLTMAHLTEWQLLWQPQCAPRKGRSSRRRWRGLGGRRWPAPSLATVAEVSENSSGIATPMQRGAEDDRTPLLVDALLNKDSASKRVHGTLAQTPSTSAQPEPHAPSYGALGNGHPSVPNRRGAPMPPLVADVEAAMPRTSALELPANRPTVLALAVAYSATSGTLSGVCLLLAKSGVDLLVLSLRGNNQLASPMSWFLVVILLTAALLQLWYLNKSLKLADPVLVCPLAFCFYNISSITLGLVYFNELAILSWLDVFCVCFGTGLLLCGVWVISLHHSMDEKEEVESASDITLWGPGWHDPAAWHDHDALSRGAATSPLAGPLYSAAVEDEHTRTTHSPEPVEAEAEAGPSLYATPPRLTRDAPLAPHLAPRHGRSTSMPVPPNKPTISLDHALTQGMHTSDRAHMNPARRPTLYGILVERGLSIGLSPSSPGFHVSPRRAASAAHASPSTPRPRRFSDSHGDA